MARRETARIAVRWRDIDALGHVNNAVFLSYAEVARDRLLLRALPDESLNIVIARIEVDFHHEVPMGTAEVVCHCDLVRLGNTSIHTQERVELPNGAVAASCRTVSVVRDPAGHARTLSPDERQALTGDR